MLVSAVVFVLLAAMVPVLTLAGAADGEEHPSAAGDGAAGDDGVTEISIC